MARKRLKLFTGGVLFIIVVLTVASKLLEAEKPGKHFKRYYIVPQKTETHNLHNTTTIASELGHEASFTDTPKDDGHQLTSNMAGLSKEPGTEIVSTLTRYGANIPFDHSQSCPKDSLMRTDWKKLQPRTRRCPQVFIVGAKKGGTTSLYQYLSKHPDFEGIRLNESKWIGETFYFAQKYTSLSLSKYIHLFPKAKMTGDASVDNLLHCKSPERILKTCGRKSKIIILLRNPINRYVSNFMMRVRRPEYGKFNNFSSISDTTKEEFDILKSAVNKKGISLPQNESEWPNYRCLFSCCKSMIYEGMYYVFVMNWLCNFPKENIMFLNSEEMFRYPTAILKEVLTFLGLRPLTDENIKHITSYVYNKGLKPHLPQHQINRNDIRTLNTIYGPFNKGLLNLLDWSGVDWSS